MPKVGSFSISIVNAITDIPYEEHQVGTKDIHTECHIESKSGDKFKILVQLDPTVPITDAYSAQIFVDGKLVSRKLMGRTKPTRVRTRGQCLGWEIGPKLCAPFIFGDTQFAEEGLSDKTRLLALGTIMINIHRVRCHDATDKVYRKIEDEEKVCERAKKALLIHSVKYGKPERVKSSRCRSAEYIDSKHKPFQSFTFLYRSRTILEALEIIPTMRAPEAEFNNSNSTSEFSKDDEDEEDHDDVYPTGRIRKSKGRLHELEIKVKREPKAPPELLDLTQPEAKKRRVIIDLTYE